MDFFDVPAFTLNLQAKVEQIASGQFDDTKTSLVCATQGGKILVYTPNAGFEQETGTETDMGTEKNTFSINGKVTGIGTGRLDKSINHDILAIGLENSVRAYNINLNSDIYFVNVPDGVNCISVHANADGEESQVYAAGNGSIKGFDSHGHEVQWMLSGEDCVSMCSYRTKYGDRGLLVATANCRVQFFKKDEVIFSISESDEVSHLTPLSNSLFALCTSRRTVVVYESTTQMWRFTFPADIVSLASFDCDQDEEDELVIALDDGTVEVRRSLTGSIISAGKLDEGIIGMTVWNTKPVPPNASGEALKPQSLRLTIVTNTGIVKGFRASNIAPATLPESVRYALLSNPKDATSSPLPADAPIEEIISFLTDKRNSLEKQELEMERVVKNTADKIKEANAIPEGTVVQIFCKTNEGLKRLEAHCTTNREDIVIYGILLLSDVLFPQGCYFHYCEVPGTAVALPINPPKYKPLKVQAKILAGTRASTSYHVFNAILALKRFPLHVCATEALDLTSYTQFLLNDRIERVALWLSQAFPLVVKDVKVTEMAINFKCFGDPNDPLSIHAFINDGGGVKVYIYGMHMETVSEVCQDLYDYFKIGEMEAVAVFPQEMDAFQETLRRVVDLNKMRLSLTADIAERTGGAKTAMVKAEDARLLGDLAGMREWLHNLDGENKELLKNYVIRQQNHQDLTNCLKEINKVIQWASRMRRGKAQNRVINECRVAIRDNKMDAMRKIIETGTAKAK